MTTTNFIDNQTVIYADWLNDVDAHVYDQNSTSHSSNNISFLQSGTGASLKTTQSKLREIVSVKDFGAVGDGITDDTQAIQNAINYVGGLNGGRVLCPAGTYNISSTLSIGFPNVVLVGDGLDRSHDVVGQNTLAATKLNWVGAGGGTLIDIYSPEGASAQKLVGCGVTTMELIANGAGYGIKIRSQNFGKYEFLHFNEFSTACIYMTTVTTLGEARDPQNNVFRTISSRNILTNGAVVFLDGDAGASPTANVSMNYFEQVNTVFKDGDAFVLKNSDHNVFMSCRANRSSGTGNAIVFHGSNNSSSGTARHNIFIGFSSGGSGPIVGKGTTSYTYASTDNSVLLVDKGNATPDATIETGSSVWYSTDTHIDYSKAFLFGAFGNTAANAASARSNMSGETVRIVSSSSNQIRIAAATGTDEWGINMDFSTGNLRLNRVSGTGKLVMGAAVDTTSTYTLVSKLTSSTTLNNTNSVVLVDATSGNVTVTLPLANAFGTNRTTVLQIRRIDASANTVTIQRQSTDTLNGGTSETLAANAGKTYVCDSVSAWFSF